MMPVPDKHQKSFFYFRAVCVKAAIFCTEQVEQFTLKKVDWSPTILLPLPGWRHHRLGCAVEPEAGGDTHHPHLNCQQVSRDVEEEGDDNDGDQNWKWQKLADHYIIVDATHTTYDTESTHGSRCSCHGHFYQIRINLDKNLSLAKTSLTEKQSKVLDQLWEKYFRSPSLLGPQRGYF